MDFPGPAPGPDVNPGVNAGPDSCVGADANVPVVPLCSHSPCQHVCHAGHTNRVHCLIELYYNLAKLIINQECKFVGQRYFYNIYEKLDQNLKHNVQL